MDQQVIISHIDIIAIKIAGWIWRSFLYFKMEPAVTMQQKMETIASKTIVMFFES
jgi:hypothetical protein